MKGTILDYSVQNNTGYISGDDSQRYSFSGADWRSNGVPSRGQKVDFTVNDNQAKEIFLAIGSGASSGAGAGEKSGMVAGFLAIFLGWLGIHKFYLGYKKSGIILLLCGTVGSFFVIPWFVAGLIGLVEGILYLSKHDDEFQRIYVQNTKEWF